MLTISDQQISTSLKVKKDSFTRHLELESFFLLIKGDDETYSNFRKRQIIENSINKIVKAGLINLEISWSNNEKWLDFVSKIKFQYPHINLGSASIVNKKSIDDSLKIGLKYSMMKYWDRDLYNYAKENKHLLIPGIKNVEQLQEAINCNCKIIKIYPIKSKDELIDPLDYKDIVFIAAGGLSIQDIDMHKELGYKAIVVGEKGIKEGKLDETIIALLKKINQYR